MCPVLRQCLFLISRFVEIWLACFQHRGLQICETEKETENFPLLCFILSLQKDFVCVFLSLQRLNWQFLELKTCTVQKNRRTHTCCVQVDWGQRKTCEGRWIEITAEILCVYTHTYDHRRYAGSWINPRIESVLKKRHIPCICK